MEPKILVPYLGPFFSADTILMALHGITHALYPWLVIDERTIWDSAGAPGSLLIILSAP
ncbi:MAG: hypothetical protein AAFX44_18985 [Pseudomonadota bacterium]